MQKITNSKSDSLQGKMTALEVGGTMIAPVSVWKYSYIRNCASQLGIQLCRRSGVRFNRADNACTITRHE